MGVMLHTATDSAFLASILEAPDDDAPRLIYADWLDEQGESDRAEFIRLQVREARMAADDPELPALRSRTRQLGLAYHVKWVNRLPYFEGVHWEIFERGFIGAARFDHPDTFFAHAAHWLAFATKFRWLKVTAFGAPVVPPVGKMYAGSKRDAGTAGWSSGRLKASSSLKSC